jgi:peptidoglycan hydrolase-like protein with peptidoglycan-binding domain
VIVTVGFFVVLALLIGQGITASDPNTVNIVNIVVGVLGTAFATVVNFWLGSSSSSRTKDDRAAAIQQVHAAQTGQILQSHLQSARAALDAVQRVATTAVTAARAPLAPAPPAAPSPSSRAVEDDFDRCVAITLAQEGGFSEAEGDPGGATKFGITLGTLRGWRGRETTAEDVRALTRSEAIEIYRADYWNRARCGDLPAGVDLMVFDFGVNAGPRTAVRYLQEALGVTADGVVGPRTLAAARAADAKQVIGAMSRSRLAYYRGLPTFDRFGAGWTRRTEQVTAAALAMV